MRFMRLLLCRSAKKRELLLLLAFSITASAPMTECGWAENPAQTPTPLGRGTSSTTTSPGIDVTELKIRMAEASIKVSWSDRNVNALISSLEEFLNQNCFTGLMTNFSYEGPPTDPTCIARMEQLLKINPDNPAALCLRDGMSAPGCISGYKTQQLVQFYDSQSLLEDLPDPSLKVGLTAAEVERIKVQQEMLSNINQKFQSAQTDEEKQKYVNDAVGVYDQLMATACRIVALRVQKLDVGEPKKEDSPMVAEARKKLLQIPPHLRGDYQNKMRLDAEEELLHVGKDAEKREDLMRLLSVIDNPEEAKSVQLTNLQRTRIVLKPCYDAINQSKAFIPLFPGATCYSQGFQTPQCIVAVRNWHQLKAQERKKVAVKPGAKPTPEKIISSF